MSAYKGELIFIKWLLFSHNRFMNTITLYDLKETTCQIIMRVVVHWGLGTVGLYLYAPEVIAKFPLLTFLMSV